MIVKYTNRYKEVQTFEVNEKGNIQWKADFEFNRVGFNDDPIDGIMMVDPPGGPFINLGYDMGMFDKSFDGMIVKEFISNDDGWEIVTINEEQTVSEKDVVDYLDENEVDNRSLLEREHPDFPKSQRKIVDFLPINRKELKQSPGEKMAKDIEWLEKEYSKQKQK